MTSQRKESLDKRRGKVRDVRERPPGAAKS